MTPPPMLQDILFSARNPKDSFWFSSYLCIDLINWADLAFQDLLDPCSVLYRVLWYSPQPSWIPKRDLAAGPPASPGVGGNQTSCSKEDAS